MSKRVRRGPRESRAPRTAILERRTGAVSATAFEFFSTTAQIRKARAVMEKLLDVLVH